MVRFCSINVLKMIYYNHLHYRTSHGTIILFEATSDGNLNRELVLKKKPLKIMFNLSFENYNDPVKEYLTKLGILTEYIGRIGRIEPTIIITLQGTGIK